MEITSNPPVGPSIKNTPFWGSRGPLTSPAISRQGGWLAICSTAAFDRSPHRRMSPGMGGNLTGNCLRRSSHCGFFLGGWPFWPQLRTLKESWLSKIHKNDLVLYFWHPISTTENFNHPIYVWGWGKWWAVRMGLGQTWARINPEIGSCLALNSSKPSIWGSNPYQFVPSMHAHKTHRTT